MYRNKNQHQGTGKPEYKKRNKHAENSCRNNRHPDSIPNTFHLPSTKILGYKRREGVPEILHGHVSKRIYFNCGRKRCHHGNPETID